MDLEPHHVVRLLHMGRRAQEEMVHDAEHGGVGPDSQGQGEDHGGGESRFPAQAPPHDIPGPGHRVQEGDAARPGGSSTVDSRHLFPVSLTFPKRR